MTQTREGIMDNSAMYAEPGAMCVSTRGVLLQRCPFCAGNKQGVVEYIPHGADDPRTCAVRCLACHSEGPDMRDEASAVAAWNGRK